MSISKNTKTKPGFASLLGALQQPPSAVYKLVQKGAGADNFSFYRFASTNGASRRARTAIDDDGPPTRTYAAPSESNPGMDIDIDMVC